MPQAIVAPCLPAPHLMRGHGAQSAQVHARDDVGLTPMLARESARSTVEPRMTALLLASFGVWAPYQARGDVEQG